MRIPARHDWSSLRRQAGRGVVSVGRFGLILFCVATAGLVPMRVQFAGAAASQCRCSADDRAAGRCCCVGGDSGSVAPEQPSAGCCAAKSPAPVRSCCAAPPSGAECCTAAALDDAPRPPAQKPAEEGPCIGSCPCGDGESMSVGGAEPRLGCDRPVLVGVQGPIGRSLVLPYPTRPQPVLLPETPPPEVRGV